MTEPRHTSMVARRKADAADRRRRAWDAFHALQSEGAFISPTTVARRAGVSDDLVRRIPELRMKVEAARDQQHPGASRARRRPSELETATAPLKARLEQAFEELSTTRARLRMAERAIAGRVTDPAALEAALGEIARLQARLVEERNERERLEEVVAELDAELDVARERARDYLRQLNGGLGRRR